MEHGIPLIAIPNVSEGRDGPTIARLVKAASGGGGLVLDVHSDPRHNRTVLTVVGEPSQLESGMVALAEVAAHEIDLTAADGVHPRLGALDVCPFVPWAAPMSVAISTALRTAERIAERSRMPVYLYGEASQRGSVTDLPELRRGGLDALTLRAASELPADAGADLAVSARTGVVCVGARGPLIAFNVWFEAPRSIVRDIAAKIRSTSGGRTGIRALGLDMGGGLAQVSMNLDQPDVTGIDQAFAEVERAARGRGILPQRTELVGLVFQRHMPDPHAQAARLMSPPGRSLESALEEHRSSS